MIDARDRIVVGAAGGFTFWMFNALKALARTPMAGHAPLEVLTLQRLQEIPPTEPGSPGRLLLTNYPTKQILDALESTAVPLLYLHEPPELGVAHAVRKGNVTPLVATRIASASYVGNYVFAASNQVLTLSRDMPYRIADILNAACRFLNIPVGEDALLRHAQTLEPDDGGDRSLDRSIELAFPAAAATPLDDPQQWEEVQELSSKILEPLAGLMINADAQPIRWPGRIFNIFHLDRLYDEFGPSIALEGPARILFHGPYFYLPSGQYVAEFVTRFDDISVDNTFRVEVHAGAQCLARVRYKPGSSGWFRGSFEFAHSDVGAEIQIQTISDRGALDGTLSLWEFAFTQGNEAGPNIPIPAEIALPHSS